MRVWELAEELQVLSSDVLKCIQPYDRYVTSHLATVPRQALDAIRASPPPPVWSPGDYYLWHKPPPGYRVGPLGGLVSTTTPPEEPAPRLGTRGKWRYRRRPGPRQVSFEPPFEEDEYGYGNDPVDDLRYEPIWSTRDVARYFDVEPATVRQWVARGHLHPCGKEGPSHIFERHAVLHAADGVAARTRQAGRAASGTDKETTEAAVSAATGLLHSGRGRHRLTGRGPLASAAELGGVGTRGLHRLATVSPNSQVTTAQAAALVGLAPTTIRSWVRRGHLFPSHDSTPHQLRFHLADLYRAARRRG